MGRSDSEATGGAAKPAGAPLPDLQQLVAEADTGGRNLRGWQGRLLFLTAVGWSLFQLWYASPLPFCPFGSHR